LTYSPSYCIVESNNQSHYSIYSELVYELHLANSQQGTCGWQQLLPTSEYNSWLAECSGIHEFIHENNLVAACDSIITIR